MEIWNKNVSGCFFSEHSVYGCYIGLHYSNSRYCYAAINFDTFTTASEFRHESSTVTVKA